jgi:hypothetical protein
MHDLRRPVLFAAKRRSWSATAMAVLLLAGFFATQAAASDRARKKLSREELGQGFAIGSGDPALSLRVDIRDGAVASVAAVDAASANPASANPVSANVSAQRSEGQTQTMLNLRTDLDVALKFDLYLSHDGKTFEYTSTCAVTPGISGFEMWPYPVREFALGNPRVLPKGKMSCE